ncbi:MAG: ATP-binding cassette domain-containing protein [Thermodesulfobacteriota bacterium]
MSGVIRFENVVKAFGSQKVLDDVSIEFPEGKTSVIAGGSGQGKSVTLKLILGLMKPDSGRIHVNGDEITSMTGGQLNSVRENFGVLFQGGALLDSLTVYENVALPLEERTRFGKEEIRQRVMGMLAQFELENHRDKYPAQLSGGMRKRVALARALQLRPDIMLFDEPTTGLDPIRTMEIYDLFYHTQLKYGYTSIIVSHDIPKVFNLADKVFLLRDGHFTVFDSPEEILASEHPEMQAFFGQTMGKIYRSRGIE